MNFEKYDPLKKKEEALHDAQPISPIDEIEVTVNKTDDYEITAWTDSQPVIRLVEYLRMNPKAGIFLYERDGVPGLHFTPGLNADMLNASRGRIAVTATDFLQKAAQDLITMIDKGIEIPALRHVASPRVLPGP